MTNEEKLMVIKDAFEKHYVYLANATYQFEGCPLSKKREWTKEWMDWIVKLIEDDPETIAEESTHYLVNDDVLKVAREKAQYLVNSSERLFRFAENELSLEERK